MSEPGQGWPRWVVPAVLTALVLVHGAGNLHWIWRDNTMRGYDMGPHIMGIVNAHNALSHQGLAALPEVVRGKPYYTWPSAAYLPHAALSMLFGVSTQALRAYNLLFLLLLLLPLYLLGRRLHSPGAGLLAAALVPLYPLVYGESRLVGMDLPAAAMVTVAAAALLSTERLQRTGRCLLFGVALGLATLTRPHAQLYLALPVLLFFARALIWPASPGGGRVRVLVNTGLTASLAALTAAPWWWGRLGEIADAFLRHGMQNPQMPRDASSVAFYWEMLPLATSVPLLVALLAAAALLLVRWRWPLLARLTWLPSGRDAWFLGAWIVCGFVTLGALNTHHLRYVLPLMPALALATALAVVSVRRAAVRRALVALLLLSGAAGWARDTIAETVKVDGDARQFLLVGVTQAPWGPPQDNAFFRQLDAAARTLQRRHGAGQGVVVKVLPNVVYELMVRWSVLPIFTTRMPELRVTDAPFPIRGTAPHLGEVFTSSVPYPPPRRPITHCYSIAFHRGVNPGPARQPGCERVFDQRLPMCLAEGTFMRITLYHHPQCPHQVCQAAAGQL